MNLTEISSRTLDQLVEWSISVNTRGGKRWDRLFNLAKLSEKGSRLIPPYTESWKHAGPIIEQEKISVRYQPASTLHPGIFHATIPHRDIKLKIVGKTYLEAAMRAYVLKTFGMHYTQDWLDKIPLDISKGFNTASGIGMSCVVAGMSTMVAYPYVGWILLASGVIAAIHATFAIRDSIFEARHKLDLASSECFSTLKNYMED